jgi:predicted ATPase
MARAAVVRLLKALAAMHLDRIELQGFKSIRSMDLSLGSLNLLIGANGSGKSNLVSLFGLLNQVVERRLQVSVAKVAGAGTLLHHGPKTTQSILIKLYFGRNSYEARLEYAQGDTLFFGEEYCFFQGPGYSTPYAVTLGAGHKESGLVDQVKKDPGRVASSVLAALQSWKVHHFHDTSPTAAVKQKGPIDDNLVLRPDAANLAAFLFRLAATDPGAYRRIVVAIQQVAPFFDDFQLRPDPLRPDTIQLEWRERNSDAYFNAHALSDGTLRFICLATLLLQPSLPSLILVDEPELGLHPYAVTQLAALLKSAASTSQLLVATQSVTLTNQFEPDDIVVVDRKDGQSTFRRVGADEVAAWTDEYSLGELWEKNLLGGRPRP